MAQPALARSNVRILIIEDHTLFAESLDLALTMEGYDVRRLPIPEMGSSQGALLSAVVRLHPRIVLLDLDLGYMGDGVRLIAPIARSGAHVVVVTASRGEGPLGRVPAVRRPQGADQGAAAERDHGDGAPAQPGPARHGP